jgi:hypothetical protein
MVQLDFDCVGDPLKSQWIVRDAQARGSDTASMMSASRVSVRSGLSHSNSTILSKDVSPTRQLNQLLSPRKALAGQSGIASNRALHMIDEQSETAEHSRLAHVLSKQKIQNTPQKDFQPNT